MRPSTRDALRRAADMNPDFFRHMGDDELARHQARDNGLIPAGEVVEARYRLTDFSSAAQGGIDPAMFGIDPPGLDEPSVGAVVDSTGPATFRVASWHYEGAGSLADDGSENQVRVISLTSRDGEIEPIDAGLIAEMAAFDEGMAEIIEADLDADDKDALRALGG